MSITVYDKKNCPQCTMTKSVLKRNGLQFDVISLDNDKDALAFVKALGYMSAPVVIVGDVKDGLHWSGFRNDKLSNLKPSE